MPTAPKVPPAKDVDAYIEALAPELQGRAQDVRGLLRAALPDAEEVISYAIPAYKIGKTRVIYFAVWKKHVGLYPVYPGPPSFEAAIGPYRAKTDTVQFLHAKPLPADLVTQIALFLKSKAQEAP